MKDTPTSGKFYEHIEYFPYGETWIHNKATSEQESTPYKFTSKELDTETGLYYYGARYYDAKLSRWISVDPILSNYLNGKPAGGVFNPFNLNVYGYCASNPVKYVDPDGNFVFAIPLAYQGVIIGIAFTGMVVNKIIEGNNKKNNGYVPVTIESKNEGYTTSNIDSKSKGYETQTSIKEKNGYENVPPEVRQYLKDQGMIPPDTSSLTNNGITTKAPEGNNGDSGVHGGVAHNALIDNEIARMKKAGYTDIRKHQAQVDVNGNKVGSNLPDVQGTINGVREIVEFDTKDSNGIRHEKVIRQNDPNAKIILKSVD